MKDFKTLSKMNTTHNKLKIVEKTAYREAMKTVIRGEGDNLHEEDKNGEYENSPQRHELATSPRKGAMTLSSKVEKPKITKSTKNKTIQGMTTNVTKALSRGKLPKQAIVKLSKRKISKKPIQAKGKEKIESKKAAMSIKGNIT